MDESKEAAVGTGQPGKVYFLVIEYIKALVQKGELAFGGKLPSERQLMYTLGLGRNSVREALRSLENMGLIESRHGQGNFLVNRMGESLGGMFSLLLFLNECSLEEISQLRMCIEQGAFLMAVKQAGDTELEAFAEALRNLEHASEKERARVDKQFHDCLIEISGNRLLKLLNETLAQLFSHTIQERLAYSPQEEWGRLLAYHVQIYESLRNRDEAAGIAAIMGHYDMVGTGGCKSQPRDIYTHGR